MEKANKENVQAIRESRSIAVIKKKELEVASKGKSQAAIKAAIRGDHRG